MNVLDLFSGIGGFSLGLERAGMETVAFCEIDPKCRLVLKKHWPDVPQYSDIKELTYDRLKRDGIGAIDVICGGFPCQDISIAGKQAGITGKRSGLWTEYARLIEEIRPDYAIIESVANLRSKGLVTVLQDLWQIGYDAEWHIIPAWAVGALHRRERVWIVAHSNSFRFQRWTDKGSSSEVWTEVNQQFQRFLQTGLESDIPRSRINRVAHRLPGRVDRLKQLGNAVVPLIPQLIGWSIKDYEEN